MTKRRLEVTASIGTYSSVEWRDLAEAATGRRAAQAASGATSMPTEGRDVPGKRAKRQMITCRGRIVTRKRGKHGATYRARRAALSRRANARIGHHALNYRRPPRPGVLRHHSVATGRVAIDVVDRRSRRRAVRRWVYRHRAVRRSESRLAHPPPVVPRLGRRRSALRRSMTPTSPGLPSTEPRSSGPSAKPPSSATTPPPSRRLARRCRGCRTFLQRVLAPSSRRIFERRRLTAVGPGLGGSRREINVARPCRRRSLDSRPAVRCGPSPRRVIRPRP